MEVTSSKIKWNKEKIIKVVHKFINQNGPIKKIDLHKKYKEFKLCHPTTIVYHFGSLDQFALEANIKFKKHQNIIKWSKNKIIKRVHQINKKYGHISKADLRNKFKEFELCNSGVITKRFGSLDQFAAEAGIKFKMYKYSTQWSKNKIIKRMHQIIKIHKNIKKIDLYKKHKEFKICHPAVIIKRFGSLDQFAIEANINFASRLQWTKKRIIKQIHYIIQTCGPITKVDLDKKHKKFKLCDHTVIMKKFGSIDQFAIEAGIQFASSKKWPKYKIIKNMRNILNYYQNLKLSDMKILQKQNRIYMCSIDSIKNKFGTIKNFEDVVGFKFAPRTSNSRIGKNEKLILDEYEKINNFKIDRSVLVKLNNKRYFIDGYDPINNIAYEVDEQYHKYQQIQDKIREQNIINKLGCQFVRINEQQFLDRMQGQKNLGDFN